MLIAFKMKLFKAVAQDLSFFFFPVQANQHFVFVGVRVFFSSSPLPLYWLINSKLLRVQVGGGSAKILLVLLVVVLSHTWDPEQDVLINIPLLKV